MIVFADYDNIDQLARSRGLEYISHRILCAIGRLPVPLQPRIDVRLYGGWFAGSNLSKSGQAVSAQLTGAFPKRYTVPWHGQTAPVNVLVGVEIARSLAANQQAPLHHTFRRRPFSGKLYFRRPSTSCTATTCPLDVLDTFLSDQCCPTTGCPVEQHHVLDRCEQKLVDTMLVSDLIFWASRPNHPILSILSSDDDMWPGIRTAITFAQPIIQIHTAPSPQHSNYTGRLTAQSYLQTVF